MLMHPKRMRPRTSNEITVPNAAACHEIFRFLVLHYTVWLVNLSNRRKWGQSQAYQQPTSSAEVRPSDQSASSLLLLLPFRSLALDFLFRKVVGSPHTFFDFGIISKSSSTLELCATACSIIVVGPPHIFSRVRRRFRLPPSRFPRFRDHF